MRLTKLDHACVRLEKDGSVLVIDPGVWSGPDAMTGADAILITHEHFDHLNPDTLNAAMAANPGLELWTIAAVAGKVGDFGNRVHKVGPGDAFTAAGFGVHGHGRQHARIHHDLPVVPNTGFLIDGEVFHPGDALTVPDEPVPTLLLPASAPWLKMEEMIDYAREVAPQRGYPIHDALLNDNGLGLLDNLLGLSAGTGGGEFKRLQPGQSVEL
jgi:L-ascorbate metabolism protein UlaG (beta-lactamase superfamily)